MRDYYITKIKNLSKAVDVKSAASDIGLKQPSNVWSGRVSEKVAKKLYNQIIIRILMTFLDDNLIEVEDE